MTTTIPTSQLSSALLGSIKDNIYPDSEEVLTSELPPSGLPDVLKAITDARAELEVSFNGQQPHICTHICLAEPSLLDQPSCCLRCRRVDSTSKEIIQRYCQI